MLYISLEISDYYGYILIINFKASNILMHGDACVHYSDF